MIKAAKNLLANGGTEADALRDAGYSESIARNPQKVTRSETFSKLLDGAGLTDQHIAEQYHMLSSLRTPQEKVFYHIVTRVRIKNKIKHRKNPVPDEVISNFVSSIPGAKIMLIQNLQDRKILHYSIPLFPALKSGLELTAKSKGLMAPEKHDHGIFHEPTEEEKKFIDTIFNT